MASFSEDKAPVLKRQFACVAKEDLEYAKTQEEAAAAQAAVASPSAAAPVAAPAAAPAAGKAAKKCRLPQPAMAKWPIKRSPTDFVDPMDKAAQAAEAAPAAAEAAPAAPQPLGRQMTSLQ